MRHGIALLAVAACGDNAIVRDAPPEPPPIDTPTIDMPAGAPDITLIAEKMNGTAVVTNETFGGASCEVVESCVGAIGTRRLLRFDTVTANLGNTDLVLGPPPADGESDETFTWSPCHNHHHVENYALYELRDADGLVIGGHKQAFCLQDIEQVRAGEPSHGYKCNMQGISAGWADVYSRALPCQWIDVTDVAPGTYTLRVEVDPLGKLPDVDRSNNTYLLDVTL